MIRWIGLLVLVAACGRMVVDDSPLDAEERALVLSLSPLPPLPPSPDNPWADDPDAASFGQVLFFDERLSANGSISCASCHDPDREFGGGEPLRGLGRSTRRIPSLLGVAYHTYFGWDGGTDSLWLQALEPLEHPREMAMARTEVARVIADHHRRRYERLFGRLEDFSDERRFPRSATPHPLHDVRAQRAWEAMTEEDRALVDEVFVHVGRALEAYERRLLPGTSSFDRFVDALRGGDAHGGGHLSREARRGLRLFVGQGRCVLCHSGPLFSDHEFHNLGLPEVEGGDPAPEGRTAGLTRLLLHPYRCGGPKSRISPDDCATRFLDPDFPDFLGAFKTPSLRAARLPPFMHGRQLGSREEVIAFYRSRPGQPARGHRDLVLDGIPRNLPVEPLVTFLKSLEGDSLPESLRRPISDEHEPLR